MQPLAITAITNFILACQVFFLAGLSLHGPRRPFSARWFWSLLIIFLGTSTLIAGIDHGFFEMAGLPRYWVERTNWTILGLVTLGLWLVSARQFFAERFFPFFLGAAVLQWGVYTAMLWMTGTFLLVVVNYLPALLFLLVMNTLGIRTTTGSWQMSAGIGLLLVASAVQASGWSVFSPLTHDGLYHLIAMPAIFLMYAGARFLKSE